MTTTTPETLQHAVVQGVAHEGITVHTRDGRRARLAVIDDDGTILEAGREVERVAGREERMSEGMTYEAWRITFQSSEQAARAGYAEFQSASARLHEVAVACANVEAERDALRAELDALKAWKEEVEKQEPVGTLHVGSWYGEELQDWEFEADQLACDRLNELHCNKEQSVPLYARPVPVLSVPTEAVGYLDLGVGGYIDIGSDLSDEELSKLPKGRHALAIVGTWGVDGYVPAPAQSVSDDVLRGRVMDAVAEALGDAYDCTRVWSAWGYGTMGPDDFLLVTDDHARLYEIAEAAIQAVFAAPEAKP